MDNEEKRFYDKFVFKTFSDTKISLLCFLLKSPEKVIFHAIFQTKVKIVQIYICFEAL